MQTELSLTAHLLPLSNIHLFTLRLPSGHFNMKVTTAISAGRT